MDKNPILLGLFSGAIVYLYYYKQKDKNKKEKKHIWFTPLVVSVIVWYLASNYFDSNCIHNSHNNIHHNLHNLNLSSIKPVIGDKLPDIFVGLNEYS